ncbi:hypothetical protein [Streptomyces griseocarneus]|uniref:hypothetical protein n=1 Tax=Streptomyces griseocarneus TaxID=51201 RepID=UPI00167D9C41|nr:hypothetical protein [Streptomyces griseocarneus]MBZ6477148.1 hypothetical protein [Streptomyces griseocarneus]GHG53811.1 hypothetical protein GCM10018779_16080 [Streptomyces griseocarneus]
MKRAPQRASARTRRFLRALACATGVTALIVTATPSASAGGRSCSGQACLTVDGTGRYAARATATTPPGSQFFGHFRMYGGGLNGTSATQHWHEGSKYTLALGRNLPDHTKICVEGWEHLEEKRVARGRTCVDIHA